MPAFPEIRKQSQMIRERNGLAMQIGRDVRGERLAGRRSTKRLIGFVDEPVLIPQRKE